MLFRLLCHLAAIVLAASVLSAQNPTATLVGTVRDGSGAVVLDASLELHNTDTGEIRKTLTADKGQFTIPNLVPGPYEITVTKPGFRSVRETNIELQMDQVARIEIKLEIGTIAQTVEVNAVATPLISTENGTKGEVM